MNDVAPLPPLPEADSLAVQLPEKTDSLALSGSAVVALLRLPVVLLQKKYPLVL